jgi:CheY-like chemotaxis protein
MTGPLSLVIVEDEYLLQVLVEDMLADLGHRVLQTSGALDEAIAICQTEDFDLALLDLTLGGVPSYPAADVLNQRGIPYAFMTGHDAAEIPAAYARAPMLCKPFRSGDLAAVIARMIPDSDHAY